MTLAMTAHNFGKLPSELLGITDRAVALDFDMATMLRLVRFKRLQRQAEIENLAAAIAGLFVGGEAAAEVERW